MKIYPFQCIPDEKRHEIDVNYLDIDTTQKYVWYITYVASVTALYILWSESAEFHRNVATHF